MALPSFSKSFAEMLGTGRVRAEPPPSDRLALREYLAALRSGAPMQWLSDHLSEDQRQRGPIYVAVEVLMKQAMAAELHAYELRPDARQDGKLAKEPLPHDHPIVELCEYPNPHQTGGELRAQQVQQLCLTGTSLSVKARDDFGMVRELWSEPTGTYQPIPISPYYPNGGYRFLPWFPGPLASIPGAKTAGGVAVPAEEVLALRLPHPLLPGGEGYSPLHACRLPFDTLEMIDRGRMNRMRRGIRPSAVAEVDPASQLPTGSDLEVLRLEINKLQAGPERDGALALLSPGIKLREWNASSDIELSWIESWGQLVGMVLACFGVAKSMAFLDDSTSFAELYARLKQFDLFTLCPLLSRLSAAYNRELIWPVWGRSYGVELRPRKIDNLDDDVKRISTAQASGSIKHNEVRKTLGWEPVDEPWGEERAFRATGPDKDKEGQEGAGPRKEAPAVVSARPRNEQGRGALGPRAILNGRSGAH